MTRLPVPLIAAPKLVALTLLGSLLLGSGCRDESTSERYFPLKAGYHWLYEVERTTEDGVNELRHVITNRAAQASTGEAIVRETLHGHRYFYRQTDNGIERTGAVLNPALSSGIRNYEAVSRAYTVLPQTLKTGQRWRSQSRTSVLENSGPPWETLFRIDVPLTLEYEVESSDAVIQTAAGEFSHCLLIRGHGRANADVGNYIGHTSIEVHTREWYAPGVGLVRIERDEKTTAEALESGRLVVSLVSWKDG